MVPSLFAGAYYDVVLPGSAGFVLFRQLAVQGSCLSGSHIIRSLSGSLLFHHVHHQFCSSELDGADSGDDDADGGFHLCYAKDSTKDCAENWVLLIEKK